MRFDILEAMDQIEKEIGADIEVLLHKRNGITRTLRISVYEGKSHHYEIQIPETADEERGASFRLNNKFKLAIHNLKKALNRA